MVDNTAANKPFVQSKLYVGLLNKFPIMNPLMYMAQVHAFPCSNVLHEANNLICLFIQFILHSIQLFFKDEISIFKKGTNIVAFIFLNSSPLRKYYLLIILR